MRNKLLIVLLLCYVNALKAKDYVITEFGAISDTTVLSTMAIQAAIDQRMCNMFGKLDWNPDRLLQG
ncbi:MAG: hypothetical protein M0Q53_11440 [Prolixibacteraceae bacterium]|jgi:hypothetical protein|nr:hypothetical protein [Prolixibacteraceae bacterium]